MCGLAGLLKFGELVERSELEVLNSFLRPRGPDEEGYWIQDRVGLAHRRLSIIDLSHTGSQPMRTPQESLCIVFNGEIYNYRTLRAQLDGSGFQFVGTSDTEVLLHGYQRWGLEGLLDRIDGMFAFALIDVGSRRGFLVRDGFGKKPLYYYSTSAELCFSSDINSIRARHSASLKVNLWAIDYFLSELSVPQPHSIWDDVRQVEPGHYLEFSLDRPSLQTRRYWTLTPRPIQVSTLEDAEVVTEERLRKAVSKRTVGDVAIGCFLSGGVDSGLVAALLAQESSTPIPTYSVGFPYEDFNELPYARSVAERYGTRHHEIIVEPDIAQTLADLIDYVGEPFADSSIVPTFYVCREIGRELKVALSGDGGDEIFGGYHDYLLAYQVEQHIGRRSRWTLLMKRLWNALAYRMKATEQNLGNLIHWRSLPGHLKLFRSMGFHPDRKTEILSPEFSAEVRGFTRSYLEERWSEGLQADLPTHLMSASLGTRLLNDYLVKVDRASMANSLEVRSPFLDRELAAFAFGLSMNLKFGPGASKYLLRKIAARLCRPDMLTHRKAGFALPLKHWFRQELKPTLTDALLSGDFENRGIFREGVVRRILEQHWSGEEDHSHRIVVLWSLELWFRSFAPDWRLS